MLLEDNSPTAFSMAKGRANAPLLNYYCRRRAATNLAANMKTAAPWVQTSVVPADEASRRSEDLPLSRSGNGFAASVGLGADRAPFH